MNNKLSVLIPSRNSQFTAKTVDDIFQKATGDIEVIVLLDGYWPNPPLNAHKNLVTVHIGSVRGMRQNLNTGVHLAKGKYIMKCDDHCMFAEGFDEVLKADCEENWIAIPTRYTLDAPNWKRKRGPIDYLYLTFPYTKDEVYGSGFHGRKWKGEKGLTGDFYYMEKKRKHIKIDDIITFQGSCWFMHKSWFTDGIEYMDEKHYNFHQEAQELGFKTWLSGGRVIRNKNTWYAHLHKGKQYGRGFRLSKQKMVDSEVWSTKYWMANRWPKQTRDIKWLIDKFSPLEGWPDNWQDPKYLENWTHHWILAKKQEKKS